MSDDTKVVMPPNKKGGPKPMPLDEQRIEHLAANLWTLEEIASDQGCGVDTLHNRLSAVIEKGKLRGKSSLRSMQFQVAMGRPAMAAEYLREKQDEKGRQYGDLKLNDNGRPIKIRDEIPAEKPNVTMLIWMGKQHLGQTEKVDFGDEHADGFEFPEPPTKPKEG